MERITAPIPIGFKVGNSWIRQAELRQLNGYDEQTLTEIRSYPLSFRTTFLLETIVTFGKLPRKLGLHEVIRSLALGDRVALVLHLRRIVLGDKIQSTLNCPQCQEPISLELSAKELLQPTQLEPKKEYPAKIENFLLKLRPLTGADLEAVSEDSDKNSQVECLARSCVVYSEPPLPEKLSPEFQASISQALDEIDPQANTVLKLACPFCNHSLQAPFDIESYFFEEISSRLGQLEREVHWLAFNYHWSEKEILSLPMAKRKRYIELINATLSGETI